MRAGVGRTDLRTRAARDVCARRRPHLRLNFNGREGDEKISYGDVFLQAEQEYSRFNFEFADTEVLFRHFNDAEAVGVLMQGGV